MSSTPVKVDPEADDLATHGAHFLGVTKKQYASDAIRFYTQVKQGEIREGLQAAMARLDGTFESKVRVLSGLSDEEIDELGGLP